MGALVMMGLKPPCVYRLGIKGWVIKSIYKLVDFNENFADFADKRVLYYFIEFIFVHIYCEE